MAGVWNVNSAYNSNLRRVSSKLTFELNETITARVVNKDDEKSEVLIKTLDGWQFPASVEKPLDSRPDGLMKFQVIGFEDGKLKLRPISGKEQDEAEEEGSIKNILSENNIDLDEHFVLEKMAKHGMALTKENISRVKTVIDFMQKLDINPQEEDKFIEKYLASKNISESSIEGKNVNTVLKSFFNELKTLDIDDVLILMENKIDLNADNIKSYKELFKDDLGLYKGIDGIKDILDKVLDKDLIQDNITRELINSDTYKRDVMESSAEELKDTGKQVEGTATKLTGNQILNVYSSNNTSKGNLKNMNLSEALEGITKNESGVKDTLLGILSNKVKTFSEKEYTEIAGNLEKMNEDNILDAFRSLKGSNEISLVSREGVENSNLGMNKEEIKEIAQNLIGKRVEITDTECNELIRIIESKIEKGAEDKIIKNPENLRIPEKAIAELVKERINARTNEIKDVVRDIITAKNNLKPEIFSKIIGIIKNNINDFKVFNSISNQYYYMDLPVKLKDNEYPCKLIIKDDRRKGKKIDSKNVKLVVSVNTVNIGKVDGYIKILDNNMSITIKCDKDWIKILDLAKEKLIKNLSDLGYNLYVNVEKREEAANIATCREFFDDSSFGNINVMV